jgi:putative inorganic carbon (HCO3(-)) transporter
VPSTNLLPDRLLSAAAVVLTCVLFTRQALDPVNVIKLTALLLVAVALVTVLAVRVVRQRTMTVPWSAAGAAAVVLGLALVVSAATAPVTSTAVIGAYGRNSGLLAYGAALVLFVVGLRSFHAGGGRTLVAAVVFAGLFTATYGLLQKAGLDAIPWNNPFNPIIAALGNPNFASGYLGVAAAVGAGGALDRGWGRGWRALCGLTAFFCLVAAALSSSVQGPIAAAAGLFVVAVAACLNLRSRRRALGLSTLVVVAAAGLAVMVAGAVAKTGPAAPIFSDAGSQARPHYWDAALQMFDDAPLLGVGLDQYGAFWRSARSPEAVMALTGQHFTDAAHSVPLQMLAQGGLVLGLAYLAFVAVALVALVRGLLRLSGSDRMLLGAVGGGWMAYQLSSAVSIDQVPLIVLHFSLAGAVVAAAGAAGLREVKLPGALAPLPVSPSDKRTKKRVAAAAAPRTRPVTGTDLAVLTLIGLVAAAAGWQAFVPLRANAAAEDGDVLRARGDGTGAFNAYDRATDLLDGQSFYWIKKGQLFQQATPPQESQALAAFLEAAKRDPYEVNALLAAAGIAERAEQLDLARKQFRRAVEVDPLSPVTLTAAATFELRHGGATQARELTEDATRRLPGSGILWATLGDARAVLGDAAGARSAYARALELEPGQPTAAAGLQKLDEAPPAAIS